MKETLKYVVDNSKYVKIDNSKINDFVNKLKDTNYKHWTKDLPLKLTEKEWILLVFVIESMNFCFWKKPKWKITYKDEIYAGSNALFYSIIKEVENNQNFLDINYLNNLTIENLSNIFQGIEGEVPYLEKRYKNLKETINFIYNNNNFYEELFSIKTEKELLNYITKNLDSFKDISTYKDKTINFYKRATLLTNDLFYVSNTIKNNIKNVNNLSGCADYAIPRTFRDYGILKYHEELSKIIDDEIELPHDSIMEIEIRANMLYVIEIIKEKLKDKNIIINSVELDNIIWNMGKKIPRKTNSHHTVTIFY